MERLCLHKCTDRTKRPKHNAAVAHSMDDRSIKIDKLVNRPKVSSAVKVLRYADQLDESTHLEDALHRVQSFEKL